MQLKNDCFFELGGWVQLKNDCFFELGGWVQNQSLGGYLVWGDLVE